MSTYFLFFFWWNIFLIKTITRTYFKLEILFNCIEWASRNKKEKFHMFSKFFFLLIAHWKNVDSRIWVCARYIGMSMGTLLFVQLHTQWRFNWWETLLIKMRNININYVCLGVTGNFNYFRYNWSKLENDVPMFVWMEWKII